MRKSLIVLAVLVAAMSWAARPGSGQKAAGGSTERGRWAADLDVLAKELPARHKNLFFKITSAEFQAGVAALKARIPKLDRTGFLLALARLVASVGDSHTSFTIMPERAFPLKLYWFKEGLCVTDTASEFAPLLNGRLESVDGHPVEEVVEAFAGIIPHDNDAQVKDFVPRFLASSEHLLGLGLIARPDEATFSVRTPDGRTVSAMMTSVPLSAIKSVAWAAPAVDPSRLPLYRRTAGSAYESVYLPESRTLYFAYNSCRDLPDRPFAAFAAGMWDTIRTNPVERLVVDLRNNGGGDSSILDPFIAELAAAKEINRKGHLFVIVGRRTFSSAILNALDLRKKTAAVFYGEPTGGKPNHYGEIQTLTLPNLGLKVSYSTKYFQFVDGDDPSLTPDITIELGLEDHLALRDPVLEAILATAPSRQPPPPPPPSPAVKIPPLAIKGTERMIDVGGRRLHALVYGAGGPTAVLVSGFQAPQAYWNPIVPGIAEMTTIVTYDRAGYGKSETGDLPLHGRQSADDLHVLLGKLGVPKPYLLVGHSYGGRIVRLFAAAYPADTAGLVLEEAGHEDLADAQLEALAGKDRETLEAMIAPFRTKVADPRTETDYMAETVEQLRRSGPLPRVPLVVITAATRGSGLPPVFSPEGQARLAEVAMAMQNKLVDLVPGAEHILVEGAGHNVHLDKPEAVLAPIRAMVTRLRGQPAK